METNHIVKSYDNDLDQLRTTVLTMGALVAKQFRDALLSLQQMDKAFAQEVIAQDHAVDQLEARIDQLALQILALRQPVAFDLRMVIAILKMANHLERMGDYAANISRRVLVLHTQPDQKLPVPQLLLHMGELIHAMMSLVWEGFRHNRKEVMEQAWERDQEVDQLYNTLLHDLLTDMVKNPTHIALSTHYLLIAKNVERIGDHTTNLGEIIAIMVRGKPLKEFRHRALDPQTPSSSHDF